MRCWHCSSDYPEVQAFLSRLEKNLNRVGIRADLSFSCFSCPNVLYLPREGDCEYSTLKFGENFCLTSGFESGSTKYYEGSHLIEAIRDRDYLQNVDSLVNEIKLQATTALKQEIVRKTNEKLRRVIVDDYVEIESIDRYIKLKGRDGASEGQTLTSREEFLDAFNVAMQFYEKKDS